MGSAVYCQLLKFPDLSSGKKEALLCICMIGRFYTRGRIIRLDELGQHSLFVWLFVSSVKTGTRRIIRLDTLSSVVRHERRTTEDSTSGRIMRLVSLH